jgi:hypothetical protein
MYSVPFPYSPHQKLRVCYLERPGKGKGKGKKEKKRKKKVKKYTSDKTPLST